MSYSLIQSSDLTSLADTVRAKTSTSATLSVPQITNLIDNQLVSDIYNISSNQPRDDMIDHLWSNLTFNITNGNYPEVFKQYRGSHDDWSGKTLNFSSILNNDVNVKWLFYNSYIKKSPVINFNNANVIKLLGLFGYSLLEEVPNGTFVNFAISATSRENQGMFGDCFRLKSIPANLLSEICSTTFTGTTLTSPITKQMFYYCYSLREIVGAPYENTSNKMTSNLFSDMVLYCGSLKRLTFYKPNNNVGVMNATNQYMDLATVGYWKSDIQSYLATYTGDSQAFFDSTTANYVTNLSNEHYYGSSVADATYNRISAVETINSLPDLSAANGSNTLRFKANMGSAGGDEYNISKLSQEEIAVAAAKGWTVSYS